MFKKLLVLLLVSFSITGCSLVNVVEADHTQHGGMLPSSADFSMNDLMFAQMMIPHHEQAIQMAEWAKSRAKDPEVKKIAEQILAAQGPEIDIMSGWLEQAKQAIQDHSGHMDMAGMLTADELIKLKSLSGEAFDKYFLESMIKHHEGAVVMAQDAMDTSNETVRTLLEDIIQAQAEEIKTMQDLLVSAN
jgi:uncharacterized protein (DUF305 family)